MHHTNGAKLPPDEIKDFFRLREIILELFRSDLNGIELSSKLFARAVSDAFGVSFVDGTFLGRMHSWCLTESGHIIDVFPPNSEGTPVLCAYDDNSIWRTVYRTSQRHIYVTSRGLSDPTFRNNRRKLARRLRAIAENTPASPK